MSTLVLPGDVIRVTDKMTAFTEQCRNVYHVQYSGATFCDSDSLMTGAKAWLEGIHGDVAAIHPSQLSYDSVECFNVTQDVPLGELAMITTTEGEVEGETLPLQAAAVLRFPTETARSQGRKFIPALTEGAQDDGGVLGGGTLAVLATVAGLIMDGFSAGTGTCLPGNYNKALDRFAPWLTALVNVVIGTQRRRQFGRGA
jgi:hypothetical protein